MSINALRCARNRCRIDSISFIHTTYRDFLTHNWLVGHSVTMHCVPLNSRRTFTRITQVDRILDLRLKVGNRDGFTTLFFWLVGSGRVRNVTGRIGSGKWTRGELWDAL